MDASVGAVQVQTDQLAKDLERISATQTKITAQNTEIQNSYAQLELDIQSKLSVDEGRQLWVNFGKFASYDDLKTLYRKCIPAIAAVEADL